MGITTAIGAGLSALGIGAETAAAAAPVIFDVGAGALGGGAIGGITSAATGGNIGQGILHGAEGGALTGGGIGLAGATGLNAAIGATAGDAIGGAAGGALGGLVTGGDPLLGAAEGGIAGGITGYNSSGAPVNGSGNTVGAPSSTTNVSSPSGSIVGAGQAGELGANSVNANLGGASASTSTPTSMGSLFSEAGGGAPALTGYTPSADSVLNSTSADAIGSTGSGGIRDFLPSKGDVGKAALTGALPLAGVAYQAVKGPPPLPSATQPLGANGAVTAPLIATETAQANAFNSGNLTAPQQASLDEWVQNQQNAILQQLASEGVTNPSQDSRYIGAMANLEKQALAQKQQMLQQDINNAFTAAGAAGSNLGSVANAQVANDTAYQNALAEAMAALGGGVAKAA